MKHPLPSTSTVVPSSSSSYRSLRLLGNGGQKQPLSTWKEGMPEPILSGFCCHHPCLTQSWSSVLIASYTWPSLWDLSPSSSSWINISIRSVSDEKPSLVAQNLSCDVDFAVESQTGFGAAAIQSYDTRWLQAPTKRIIGEPKSSVKHSDVVMGIRKETKH